MNITMISMQSIALAITLALCAPSPAQSEQAKTNTGAKSAPSTDALNALRKNKDEMRDIVFYEHPTTPKYRNSNSIHLYFGKAKDGRLTDVRFVMQYHADDWLFIQKAWAKADGKIIELPSTRKFSGWERDNSGGRIWEWSDAALSNPGEIAAIRQLSSAKNVIIRFEGRQYYADVKLSAKQLKAMRDIISAYEAASGRPWISP